jgi:hypothetical protein
MKHAALIFILSGYLGLGAVVAVTVMLIAADLKEPRTVAATAPGAAEQAPPIIGLGMTGRMGFAVAPGFVLTSKGIEPGFGF